MRWAGDPAILWLSGDTVLYDGVREVAERLDVDIAVLHLSGAVQFTVTGPLRYSMDGRDAAELINLLKPQSQSPCTSRCWDRAGLGA